jgi:hypothetical protein
MIERAQAEARKTPTNQSKQARVRDIRTNSHAREVYFRSIRISRKWVGSASYSTQHDRNRKTPL